MDASARIATMSPAQRSEALAFFERTDWAGVGLPNIYRVFPGGRRRWQCEWDDLTEVGAFRSRSLSRCVRRAQKARRRRMLAILQEAE